MRKKIFILGAGQEQIIAINEAKALGYHVLVCDANTSAPGLALADVGLVINIRSVDVLVRVAKEHSVSGIFCHAVEIPYVIAQVAAALCLPGLSPETARLCTRKDERLMALQATGIPVADFVRVRNRECLMDVALEFGFPLVLKPVDNAGSRGVQRVDRAEDLLASYDEAMRYTENPTVLLERYLTGPQISTEAFNVYSARSLATVHE